MNDLDGKTMLSQTEPYKTATRQYITMDSPIRAK